MNRPQVSNQILEYYVEAFRAALTKKLSKHGSGAFASPHEVYGVLAEEVKEVLDEVQANEVEKTIQELLDVAVVGVFGAASMHLYWKEKNGIE